MKSSFARKQAPATDLGTRPGPHGQTVLSSGHADIDRLLGGGLPLGALLLILEDGWSQHHATLLRYFLAEGAACGQSLMLLSPTVPSGGLAGFIPQEAGAKSAEREPTAVEPEGGKLRIAWQYQRYLKAQQRDDAQGIGGATTALLPSPLQRGSSSGQQPTTRSALREWCHQFDLTRSSGLEGLGSSRAECRAYAGSSNPAAELANIATEFVASLSPQQQQQQQPAPLSAALGPANVGRLAVLSLGGLEWELGAGSAPSGRAVVQSLLHVKAAVRESRCAAVVTVPASLYSASDRARMQHIADAVIALERVCDDSDIVRLAPDSASVVGLFHLRKLPSLGTTASLLSHAELHLVRHKRKRLAITPVEIDPDAEAAAAEAAGAGGAGKSVASLLCGGPAKSHSALEF